MVRQILTPSPVDQSVNRRRVAVVSGGLQNLTSREALAALSWLVDAGVDSLVEDAPFAWLAEPAAVQAPPPPVTEDHYAPCEADAVVEAVATVVGVDSLAALEARLAEFDGCALATHGSPPLFAAGTRGSALMLIGDMPSAGAACSAVTPGCCSTGCSPRSGLAGTVPISPTSSIGRRPAGARLPPPRSPPARRSCAVRSSWPSRVSSSRSAERRPRR